MNKLKKCQGIASRIVLAADRVGMTQKGFEAYVLECVQKAYNEGEEAGAKDEREDIIDQLNKRK